MILAAWLKRIGSSVHVLNPQDWIDAPVELAKYFLPGGVFTTMRLDNAEGQSVPICLTIHIDRLSKNGVGVDRMTVEKEISEFIRANLVDKYIEYRWLGLTVMLAQSNYFTPMESAAPTFGYCLKVMEEAPKSCTVLACRTKGRSDPTIKSTSWIEERKVLKDLIKGTAHNEVLIVDDTTHRILEGLSSNFGVLMKNGRMVTAPDSMVLPGSVMRLVRQACEDLEVPIDEKCPSINNASEWQAAFITSTSRLVLPITAISQIEDNGTIKIDSLSSDLLHRIQDHVNQSITDQS